MADPIKVAAPPRVDTSAPTEAPTREMRQVIPDDATQATAEIAQVADGAPRSRGALADRVRAMHQQVLANRTKTFAVPGWRDDADRPTLAATVRVLEDRDDFRATMRATDADAAFVARAVTALHMLGDDGTWTPLEEDGEPVAFDERFASMLGIEAKNRSQVVVTALGSNPASVSAFAQRIIAWMGGQTDEADEGLLPT